MKLSDLINVLQRYADEDPNTIVMCLPQDTALPHTIEGAVREVHPDTGNATVWLRITEF